MIEDNYDDICSYARKQIRAVMKERGVGTAELARRMRKSTSQISTLLNSANDIKLSTLDEVFQALNGLLGFQVILLDDTVVEDDEGMMERASGQ